MSRGFSRTRISTRRFSPAFDGGSLPRFPGRLGLAVIGLPDGEVLRTAAEAGRILASHDRKTMPRHFAKFVEGRSGPGVIVVSQDLDI